MKKKIYLYFLFILLFLNPISSIHSTAEMNKEKEKGALFPAFTFDEDGKLEETEDENQKTNSVTTKNEKEVKNAINSKKSKMPLNSNLGGQKNKAFITGKPFFRMILSICLIIGVGCLFFILSHFWKQKFQTTLEHKKMRVVTQFYLGSKKKIIILRVAGEHLLLGVTDYNISLIKTLSLLDENTSLEPEESFSKKFLKLKNKDNTNFEIKKNKEDFLLSKKNFIEPGQHKTSNKHKLVSKRDEKDILEKKTMDLDDIRSLLENRLRNKKKIS